jgi:hypothetical protein
LKIDKRDPEKLGERIKQIQKNNPGMPITKAADHADQMFSAHSNGKGK